MRTQARKSTFKVPKTCKKCRGAPGFLSVWRLLPGAPTLSLSHVYSYAVGLDLVSENAVSGAAQLAGIKGHL